MMFSSTQVMRGAARVVPAEKVAAVSSSRDALIGVEIGSIVEKGADRQLR